MDEEVVTGNVSAGGVKGGTGIRHDRKLVVPSINLDATDMKPGVISYSVDGDNFGDAVLDGIVN